MSINHHIPAIAATALAASMSISLIACNESTSASNDELPAISEPEPMPTSSETIQQSSESNEPAPESSTNLESSASVSVESDSAYCDTVLFTPPYTCKETLGADGTYFGVYGGRGAPACTYKCQHNKWSFIPAKDIPDSAKKFTVFDIGDPSDKTTNVFLRLKKCNTENEGLVDSLWEGNPKYGSMGYYRCENGSWVAHGPWITCDTTGATVGAICIRTPPVHLLGYRTAYTFVYAGAGKWVTGSVKLDEECNAEKEGKKRTTSYGDKAENTYYFECSEGKWQIISETDYHCATKNTANGDTCLVTVYDEKHYYLYQNESWQACNYDSILGFCPTAINPAGYNQEIGFRESNGKTYYCNEGKWTQTNLVPHQESDSRKDGLTETEYDKLDLPKEAKAGDRVGGLIEYCVYGAILKKDSKQETYDYCMPENYYRYREDGSWTKESSEEKYEDEIKIEDTPCGPNTWCCAETEGLKSVIHNSGYDPDQVYQCVAGEIVFVEYVFGRYEKKTE